jgi:L,D-transpeptidase ErfK/SrfK
VPAVSIVVPTRYVLPDAPREGIVINVAAMRLYYFPPHKKGEDQVVFTYPIGIGKVGWSTPMGTTKIATHKKDPVWHPSAALRKDHFNDSGEELAAVVPAGPDNPLGQYEMTLGWPSYLIHGTNKPYGIGLRSSHGCMRLYPEDIEKLFYMVPDGMTVRVVNQPFLFGWQDKQLYLQSYTVLEDDSRDWDHAQQKLLSRSLAAHIQKSLKESGDTQIDWSSVAAITHEPRGIPNVRQWQCQQHRRGAGGRAHGREPHTGWRRLGRQRCHGRERQQCQAVAAGTRTGDRSQAPGALRRGSARGLNARAAGG